MEPRQTAKKLLSAVVPFDAEQLSALLHPEMKALGIFPGMVVQHDSASEWVESWLEILASFDEYEVTHAEVDSFAGFGGIVIHYRMRRGDQRLVLQYRAWIFGEEDGRITSIGQLCAGPVPEMSEATV